MTPKWLGHRGHSWKFEGPFYAKGTRRAMIVTPYPRHCALSSEQTCVQNPSSLGVPGSHPHFSDRQMQPRVQACASVHKQSRVTTHHVMRASVQLHRWLNLIPTPQADIWAQGTLNFTPPSRQRSCHINPIFTWIIVLFPSCPRFCSSTSSLPINTEVSCGFS